MDQRTPLSQGAPVRQFVVDKIIGDGASCLVYEAHYLDSGNHRKEIILKECYPYNSGTSRIGSKIVWSSLEEQEKAFQRFNNAYEIAAKIQNEAGAQSVSVYSLDKFEENGTQYVATIPNGNSYDKTKTDDIADIIRTVLALTNAVTVFKNVYSTDGEEETEIDTILVTNNGIVFLEIKNAKKDITISQDGRLLYENQISYHNDSIGDKMEKKRRLLKYQIEKEMQRLGVDKFGKPVRIESFFCCCILLRPCDSKESVRFRRTQQLPAW